MSKRTAIISSLIIITLIGSLVLFAFTDTTPTDTTTNSPIKETNNKISGEADNTDSMDVNPKSGRWDVTETGDSDDYIIDSNLRLIDSDNGTGNQYFAQRGTTKSDGKYEYRYKSSYDGDNTSEYFRDQIGDSVDFSETDTENFINYGSPTISVENGALKIIADADWDGTSKTLSNPISSSVYTKISFKAKSNDSTFQLINYLIYSSHSTNVRSTYKIITLSTSWTTYTYTIATDYVSSTKKSDLINLIVFASHSYNNDYNYAYYIDDLKFIGSYDYVTHDNSIGNTWDWEDGSEYFYHKYNNVSDFNDGTTEGYVAGTNDVLSNLNNEYLNMSETLGGSSVSAIKSSLSIDSSVYKYIAIEFNASETVTKIDIIDGALNIVCTDSTGWSATTFHLFTCDLSLDADWTGTETGLKVAFYFTPGVPLLKQVHVNMIYLYDTNLGDTEGFTATHSNTHNYVNPEGYIVERQKTANFGNIIKSPTGLTPNTTIFDYLKIRIKASETTTKYIATSTGATIATMSVTTSWQVLEFDLSAVANWLSFSDFFYVRDLTGSANSQLYIDYILFVKTINETAQDIFSAGLWDQDNDIGLLNVTQHYWNNSYFQWRVYLPDSSNTVVSYYYSSNYTYSDVYYRYYVKYNVLTSEISVEIKTDGQDRIFKIEYPDDFTNTGEIPALFEHEKTPDIFFSSYLTTEMTADEIWIDYIEAPFKESEWRQTTSWTNSSYIDSDTYAHQLINSPSSTDYTIYRMNVPRLDALSGRIAIDMDETDIGDGNIGAITFSVYGIDKSTGDAYQIALAFLAHGSCSICYGIGISLPYAGIYNNGSGVYYGNYNNKYEYVPALDFSISITDDRSSIISQYGFYPDSNSSTIPSYVLTANYEFKNAFEGIGLDASQEFIIEMRYEIVGAATAGTFQLLLQNFDFTERDIFSDMGNFIGNVWNGGDLISGIVTAIINPIINVIVIVVRYIVDALLSFLGPLITTLQNTLIGGLVALGVLITTLQTALEAVINALQPFLTAISDAVNGLITFLQDIADQVVALATSIVDYLLTLVSDFIDAVLALINNIIDAVVDALSYLLDAIIDLLNTAFPGLGNFIRSFNNMNITATLTSLFDMITWVLTFSLVFLVLYLGVYMWGIPIFSNLDQPEKAIKPMTTNMFSWHGVSVIRINAIFLWLFLVIILGYLSWIWPGGALF